MARFESKIVGIDLGTTNTLIGYYDEIAGRGECCDNQEGTNITPSAVYFDTPESYVVGSVARDCALIYPENTAMNFKRIMGKTQNGITVDGKCFSPQQLSAMVLKSVVKDAEANLEEDVKDVVITVPAYFDASGRQATIEAGKLAGLNVRDILDEPVAALYHCDSMNDMAGKTVLIFDLGGGTLDLVAASITDDEIDEIAINGNMHLGGSDWDKLLIKYIQEKYLQNRTLDEDDIQNLAIDVEKAKKMLTSKDQTRITLSSREGRESVIITRNEFEECTKSLLQEVRKVIQELIGELMEKGISDFDKILMVGGASRMPQIQEMLAELFPNTEIIGKYYDEAVVKGAAVYAKILSEKGKLYHVKHSFNTKKLNRISTHSYGLAALLGDSGDTGICNMIYKSTALPITVTKQFFTGSENQHSVNIKVYETASSERYIDVDDEFFLGNCVLQIAEDMPKNSVIYVNFTLQEDGTLLVEGKEPKGNTRVQAVMEAKALLSEEELIRQKNELEEMMAQ